MMDHGLQLALQKTDIVILTKRRIPTCLTMKVDTTGTEVQAKPAVKYLGVMLDVKLTFWPQIQQLATKAAAVTGALGRLMKNVGGPKPSKRRMLMVTAQAILLSGAEVWGDALKVEKYRKRMASVQ